jgi:hypothetical protein
MFEECSSQIWRVAPTADQPEQPRVVGPPIAIQPAAKTGEPRASGPTIA